MTAVAAPRGGLKAHHDSTHFSVPELVEHLRVLLGAQMVAYIGEVKETRAVRLWAEGARKPSEAIVSRLRATYQVAALLAEKDAPSVVQAWFQGMNPQLDDVAPAKILRDQPLDEAGTRVLIAARAFTAQG